MSRQDRPTGMRAFWMIWAGQVVSLLVIGMINLGLIVQGLQDPNVTPENVRAVEKALGEAGVPYQLLGIEDEGHGISKPKNQKVVYLRLEEFFARAFSPDVGAA